MLNSTAINGHHWEKLISSVTFTVKHLYNKNYKTLKKGVEDTTKCEKFPCSQTRKINIVKMCVIFTVIYRFNVVLIKMLTMFFPDLGTMSLKFIWKSKYPGKLKQSYTKKWSGRHHNNRLKKKKCYWAAIMKTDWHWHKNRLIEKWKGIATPETIHTSTTNSSFTNKLKSSLFNKWY